MAGRRSPNRGSTSPGSVRKTALEPLIVLDPQGEYGPAMSKLTDTRKRFVIAHLMTFGRNNPKAAMMAGIGGTDTARRTEVYKLMHDPNVLEAIREHTDAFFKSGILRCAQGLEELTDSENEKIRLEAIKAWLGYAGVIITAQQSIRVTHEIEHVPLEELNERVQRYVESLPKLTHLSSFVANKLDTNPDNVSDNGHSEMSPIVDAEFTNVENDVVELRFGDKTQTFLNGNLSEELNKYRTNDTERDKEAA